MTGDDFRAQVAAEYSDLDPADELLCESIAAVLDDIARTRSLRDRRSAYRLVGELVRTLYARQAASEAPSLTKSEIGRKLALIRHSGAA